MRCVARCARDLPLCTVDEQLGYYCGRDTSLQVPLTLILTLTLPLTLTATPRCRHPYPYPYP